MSEFRQYGLVPLAEMRGELACAARGVPLRARDGSVRAFALVDPEDYGWVSEKAWHLGGTRGDPYAKRNVPLPGGKQTQVPLHRVLMGLEQHDPRKVDHINHDTLDNRRSNLRVCTHQQNHQNRRHEGDRGSSSRYRGVSWCKEKQRWQAYVCPDGHQRHLGFFDDEDEAGRVAADARRELMSHTTD